MAEVKQSTSSLPKNIFDVKPNTQAIFDTILSERASRRQGTHSVKHRGEVSGGGKKPWRQKGTGRARAGSSRSPIWVGGGVTFGPSKDRNYTLLVNKKVRKLALASALTLLSKKNGILVDEIKLDKISTKELLTKISNLKLNKDVKNILIITQDEKIFKSAANVQNIQLRKVSSLSVESVVHADVLIISKGDLTKLEEVFK